MASGQSESYPKLLLPAELLKQLDLKYMRAIAEVELKTYGLSYSSDRHNGLVITGAPNAVLELAVDCLRQLLTDESWKKKNKGNPECSLFAGKVKYVFHDEKAHKIWSHKEELKSIDTSVKVYQYTSKKMVDVSCSYSSYPDLKWKLEHLTVSSPLQYPKFNSDSKSPSDKSFNHSLEHDKNGQSFCSVQAPGLPFQFQCKRILVHLSQGFIEKIKGVDAIVNAASEDLNHIGGVALSISNAAGQKMKDECIKHVKEKGHLKVSEIIVTTAGQLPYRGIIHSVGPRRTGYDHEEKCAIQLHQTIVNILCTADKHYFSKIAMPAIGAGMFGLPKDICANVYVRAIIDYSQQVRPSYTTEVHFVDINPGILLAIKTAYENWRKNPDAVYFTFSSGGTGHFSQSMKGHACLPHGGASHVPCQVHYICKEPMPFGVQQTIFRVENRVTVRIYSGSIVKVSGVDALVCSVGSDFKGGKLSEVFESVGGASYTKALHYLRRQPPSVGDVALLLQPGDLKSKYVLLAIMESRKITTVDSKTAQKLKDLYVKILEKASAYGMKKIALTLLGSGMLVNDATNLECCCNSLFDGLTNSQVVRGICVEDIQVVNVHPQVTDAIVRVFNKRSSQSQAKSNSEGGVVGESNSSGERMPKLKKSDLRIRRAQSLKNPRDHKKGEGKKERGKFASMHVPSSPMISQDEDDNYNKVQGFGMQWKDRNEVKQKERAQYSSLSSKDEDDADNFDQDRNEKLQQKETRKNHPKAGDGVSWMGTINGGKAGNLSIFGVEAGQVKTIKNVKIDSSGETCNSDDCAKTAKETLSCGHKFCEICFIPMQRNHVCTICSQKSVENTLGASLIIPRKETKISDASSNCDTCIICMEKLDTRHKLPCGHDSFHKKCIDEAFVYKEVCPLCGKVLGTVTGSQPEGTMKMTNSRRSLPGYEGCGLIEIFYEFHDGIQSDDHPHPRKPYRGTRRKAYLPDNPEGQNISKMLEVAFHRKLVFTIGESRTTGKTDTVTWNDIHHKTRIDGGPSNYGYPDPDYLRRVKDELKAKGVTEADI